MTSDRQTPPLRLVTESVDADEAVSAEPLAAMVQRIEDLPLRERPAAFDRVNANLVAELNALEEV